MVLSGLPWQMCGVKRDVFGLGEIQVCQQRRQAAEKEKGG